MANIEAQDKENVAVTIIDGWVEKAHVQGEEKIIIKLTGQDEKGGTGQVTLWMTDDVRDGQTDCDATRNLQLLESLGMADGEMMNFPDWVESKPPATFAASKKDDKPLRFFLRAMVEKIDAAEASELIAQIRGKAAAVAGTPVEADSGMGVW